MDREVVKIADLKAAPYNPRRISKEAADGLTKSLERWGVVQEVVANKRTGHIVGGHQRVAALKKMGIKEVPVVWVDLDDVEEKALNVALNNPHISGEFDDTIAGLLAEIRDGIGPDDFAELKLDDLLPPDATVVEGNTDPDDVPEVPEEPITKPGDLWVLGDHRLLCGDSTNIQHVERLMDGKKADMVFTDPPYGFSYIKKSDGTSIQNDGAEFEQIISDALSCVCVDTAYVCGDAKTAVAFLRATSSLGNPKNCIVWVKPIQHRMHRYEPCHEFIWYWGDNGSPFYGPNVFEAKREIHKFHPTVKPVELVEYCIDSHSNKKVVLDFFGGSGTTLIACERTKRHCRMMELDPAYCDVIVKRWEDFTGKKAKLEEANDATG